MNVLTIVEAEAGLARGVLYALVFAVPLWVAIAGAALLIAR
jgi:hypothetical protein